MEGSKQSEILIKKLISKQEMLLAYPLIKQLYDKVDLVGYSKSLDEMIEMGNFKMIGAFDGDRLVGVSGYFVMSLLYCGRYIQISNFVVDHESRGSGVGEKILNYVEEIGRELGCSKFVLDSYSENKKSHSLYFREGFHIRGFHFMKEIK